MYMFKEFIVVSLFVHNCKKTANPNLLQFLLCRVKTPREMKWLLRNFRKAICFKSTRWLKPLMI